MTDNTNQDIIEFINGIQMNKKRLKNVSYYVEHWDRYLKTIAFSQNFIKINNLKVLEIGFSPLFMPLFVSKTGKKADALHWISASAGSVFEEPKDYYEDVTINLGLDNELNLKHYYNVNMERKPLPLPDATFDVVFLLDVIEHFLFDPAFALYEIGRVMKDQGILIISTDNSFRLAKILQMLIYGSLPAYKYRKDPYSRHNCEFTKRQLEVLVKSLGFSILDCRYVNLSMHKYKKDISHYIYEVINAITLLFPRFSRHIFLCASKNQPIKMNYTDVLFKEIDEYL